jgi:hypothetical protein
VQVTDQVTGAPTFVATDWPSDVFWTVCGLPDEVEQSAGNVSEKAVSTIVGP